MLFIPLMLVAQDASIEEIKKDIRGGKADALSAFFDHSLEIVTPETDGVYSQNQAIQVLKTFFNKYPCSSLDINHTGNSTGGAKFLIGTYESNGTTFRLSVFLKKVNQNFVIQQLSFEE